MSIFDPFKSIGNAIGQFGKHLVSEYITNKDMSKGILDYDKYQEYNKMLEAPGLTAQDSAKIQQQMADDRIIDPFLFGNYTEKALASQKKMKDSDKQVGEYVYNFRESMKSDITDEYKKGGKYEREVLTKAVDRLSSQYQMLADNVVKTIEDTGSTELKQERDKLRPEYEQLIRDSAKKYSQYINQGMTFNQAYDRLISEGKDQANRIVQIQNKLSNTMYWKAGVRDNIKKASSQFGGKGNRETGIGGLRDEVKNVPKGMFTLGKTLMNVIGGVEMMIGQGIEEGKQFAIGGYDVLEELNNLNVYKDSGPIIDKVRTLKSWGWSVIDALPTLAPAVAGLIFGNKGAEAMKLDQVMTAALRGGKIIDGARDVSRIGKFASESIQDLLWMDMVAQPLIGRPITTEDFQENWMFNIPINAFLGTLVRSSKLVTAMPESVFGDGMISENALQTVRAIMNGEQVKNASELIYFEKKFAKLDTSKLVEDMIGVEDRGIKDNKSVSNISIESLPDTEKKFIQENLFPELQKKHEAIKAGRITKDDALINEEMLKDTKRTIPQGETPQAKYDRITSTKEFIEESFSRSDEALLNAKLYQSSLKNLIYQGDLVSHTKVKEIISELPESMAKDALNMMRNQDIVSAKRLESSKQELLSKKLNFTTEIEKLYQTILTKVIEGAESRGVLKPGAEIGNYIYLGDNRRWNYMIGKEVSRDQLFKKIRPLDGANMDLKTSIVGKSDYFEYSLPSNLQKEIDLSNANGLEYINASRLITAISGKPEQRILDNINLKNGTRTRLNNLFKSLGIKYETSLNGQAFLNSLTTSIKNANELLEITKSLEKKGFSIKELTDKELAMYKLAHVKDYIDMMVFSGQKTTNFKAWFEKLYINEDGINRIDINRFPITKKESIKLDKSAIEHNIKEVDITSAQIITKKTLNDTLNLDKMGDDFSIESLSISSKERNIVEGLLGDMKDTALYLTMKDAIMGAISHIKLSGQEKVVFLEGYAEAIGGLLGDWTSRRYLLQLFMGSTEQFKQDVIKGYIARSFTRKPELRGALLKTLIDKMSIISEAKSPGQYKGIVDLIASLKLSDDLAKEEIDGLTRNFPYISPRIREGFIHEFENLMLNEIKKTSPENSREAFNVKRMKLNSLPIAKEIKDSGFVNALYLTDSQIRNIADIITYNSLHKYGINNASSVRKISNGTYNMIKDFKDKASKRIDKDIDVEQIVKDGRVVGTKEIKKTAEIKFKDSLSIERLEDSITLNIKDYTEFQILSMLGKDSRFKHLSIHEMAHVDQHIGSTMQRTNKFNLYREVLDRLKLQYKELQSKMSNENFGGEYERLLSDYFGDFDAKGLTTKLRVEEVTEIIDDIRKNINDKTFILNDFKDKLISLYNVHSGLDTSSLYILKESLAEALAQMELYGKIGLTAKEFGEISRYLDNASKLIDKIEGVFLDIGRKYSKSEIESTLTFSLPQTKESLSVVIDTPTSLYNDMVSPVVNQGFLGDNFMKTAKGIPDNAITKRKQIFNYAKGIYAEKKIAPIISLDGLERVIRKNIGGYSQDLIDGLKTILGKNNQYIEISKIFINDGDIKRYASITNTSRNEKNFSQLISDIVPTLEKNKLEKVKQTSEAIPFKHIDEYMLNKIVANILSTKNAYSEAAIEYLNKRIYNPKLELEISNLRIGEKDNGAFTKLFYEALENSGINIDGITLFNLKKKIGGDEVYKNLANSINNYIQSVYYLGETNIDEINKRGNGVIEQLKPILGDIYERNLKEGLEEMGDKLSKQERYSAYVDDGKEQIIDDIVGYIRRTISERNEVFKYDPNLITSPKDIVKGGIYEGLEYNGLLLVEGLYQRKDITIKELLKLGANNQHFVDMFKKYGLDRNNPADIRQYIKRNGLNKAWTYGLINKPLEIVFKSSNSAGESTSKTVKLKPYGKQADNIMTNFLSILDDTKENKSITLMSDEVGITSLSYGDTNIQFARFFDSSIGKYILGEMGIEKTIAPNVEQLIERLPIIEQMAKDGHNINKNFYDKLIEGNKVRESMGLPNLSIKEMEILAAKLGTSLQDIPLLDIKKSPYHLINEIYEYYGKDIELSSIKVSKNSERTKLKSYTAKEAKRKFIYQRLGRLLGRSVRGTREYINSIVDRKIILNGQDVSDVYRIEGFNPHFKLEDKEGDIIFSGKSNIYVNSIEELEAANQSFMREAYSKAEDMIARGDMTEMDAENLRYAMSEGRQTGKIDYDINTYQVKLYSKDGYSIALAKKADPTKFKDGLEIIGSTVKKQDELLQESIEPYYKAIEKSKKLDKKSLSVSQALDPEYKGSPVFEGLLKDWNDTISKIADDFKC